MNTDIGNAHTTECLVPLALTFYRLSLVSDVNKEVTHAGLFYQFQCQ